MKNIGKILKQVFFVALLIALVITFFSVDIVNFVSPFEWVLLCSIVLILLFFVFIYIGMSEID